MIELIAAVLLAAVAAGGGEWHGRRVAYGRRAAVLHGLVAQMELLAGRWSARRTAAKVIEQAGMPASRAVLGTDVALEEIEETDADRAFAPDRGCCADCDDVLDEIAAEQAAEVVDEQLLAMVLAELPGRAGEACSPWQVWQSLAGGAALLAVQDALEVLRHRRLAVATLWPSWEGRLWYRPDVQQPAGTASKSAPPAPPQRQVNPPPPASGADPRRCPKCTDGGEGS